MEPVEFQAKSERLDDLTLVVSVAGELDVYTVPHLERALLAADGARSVVVELSECTFVDSSTLAVLLEASRRLSLSDARLLIVATSADVLRPFELTGLDSEFAFHASVAAALNGGMR